MNRKDRAKKIGQILDTLFPHPPIPLSHTDDYTLLIAVLLSAQCTDARVNLVTPQLFALANTPEEMAKIPVTTIQEVIKSCGLAPTKAKAIANLSRILVERYKGRVPKSYAALESLPGVGHKTASVLMAQAFHKPAFPVDTHIHRCAKRWLLSSGKNVEQTERDLKKLFPSREWIRRHLQIIYFARRYCTAKAHHLDRCPICCWVSLVD